MAEPLESFKRYIGKSEKATDVVTASVVLKFAATLGLEDPPMEKGAPIPPGWYGGFFPASHRPAQMRADGQAIGGGIMPAIPLPRRRIGGTRMTFHEPLKIGDDITRVTEIADIRIDDGSSGAMATVIERNSISNNRGLAVVEERDLVFLSAARAEAAAATSPAVPAQATWRRVIEPYPALLFRFSAIRFNSHRIHYDRDYVTNVERLPGLVVQSSLVSQLLIEMCRSELPSRHLSSFGFTSVRQIYDTGKFTVAGTPAADGGEVDLWVLDANGNVSMTARATFA